MGNVPAIQFTSSGLILPSEGSVLSGAIADIDDAFGGGVNPALKTPQGQLASSIAKIIADKNEQVALIANQVNPDYSDGIWQDAIARIYLLDRKVAISTKVLCECVGEVGKQIAAGAKAIDLSDNIYSCVDGGTIPVGGTISLYFENIQTGPIPCPANSLVYIQQADPGWDTINNPVDGVVGRDVESRAEFEFRRRNSVALSAHGSLESVYAAVFNCGGVTDVYATQNYTNATILKGSTNYPLIEHSLYVAVVGGGDEEIATAIWLKKDLGCDCNGNTSISIKDTTYAPPYPTYLIKFQRPTELRIKVGVTIIEDPALPADIINQIKTAIAVAFVGGDGGDAARIGTKLFASRFYAPIAQLSYSISIVSLLIGVESAALPFIEVGIDQKPTIVFDDITVVMV